MIDTYTAQGRICSN